MAPPFLNWHLQPSGILEEKGVKHSMFAAETRIKMEKTGFGASASFGREGTSAAQKSYGGCG